MTVTVDLGQRLAALIAAWTADGAWRAQAACAAAVTNGEATVDAWWPERGADISGALAICSKCRVRRECLDFALSNSEREGIWGGRSARRRRGLATMREEGMKRRRDPFATDAEMREAQGEIDLEDLNARPDIEGEAEPTDAQRAAFRAARDSESREILDEIAAYREAFGNRWPEAFHANLDLP